MKTLSLVSVALLVRATDLFAQTPPRPDPLETEALNLHRAGHPDQALGLYQRALASSHSARVEARLGLCEGTLGHFIAAEAHIAHALESPNDPWVRQERASLHVALQAAQHRLATLRVQCSAPGCEVWAEGHRVAAAPFAAPLRVMAGRTPMEFRAEGYVPVTRFVTIEAGQILTESVSLDPVRLNLAPMPSSAPPAAPATTQVLPPLNDSSTPQRSDGSRGALAWTAASGAVVFAGLGLTSYLSGASAADHWNSNHCLEPGRTRGEVCGDEDTRAQTLGALGAVGMGLGAALAVTSIVLFALPSSPRRSAQAFSCGDGPGTLGLSCRMVF